MQPPVENEKPQWPTPFEAVLVLVGSMFFMALLHSIYLVAVGVEDPSAMLSSMELKLFTITGGLSIGVFPLIFARIREYDVVSLFRLNPLEPGIILYGVGIGLCLAVLGDEVSRLVELAFPVPEEIRENLAKTVIAESFAEFIVLFIGVVIIASVVEEALFRGFLQVSMEKQIDVTRAVVISTVAWAAMHLNPEMPAIAIPLLLSGFISGYLAWRTNSIVLPIAIHAVNNLLALIYYNMDFEEIFFFYAWNGHVSPILIIGCIAGLYVMLTRLDAYYSAMLRSSSTGDEGSGS
ncbi:MAG: lysostaphin resistance A-like protein [Calditrichia bacterium]